MVFIVISVEVIKGADPQIWKFDRNIIGISSRKFHIFYLDVGPSLDIAHFWWLIQNTFF